MTDIWQHALQELRQKVSPHHYDAWFGHIRLHRQVGTRVYLEVADDFFKAWIEDNYLDLIEGALKAVSGLDFRATLDVQGAWDEPDHRHTVELASEPVAARQVRLASGMTAPGVVGPAVLAAVAPSVEHDHQVSLFPLDFFGAEPALEAPAPGEGRAPEVGAATPADEVMAEVIAPALAPAADLRERLLAAGLNPRHTFADFVAGPSNAFTHAACAAVAKDPGRAYNPLFIFGGVGLGKSHLLQAVGIAVVQQNPQARVRRLSAEEFMNQLVHSLRQRDMANFRAQFRQECDVLLVDDIQFMGGKDSTQEEFFHTFNALHQAGKQVVVTANGAPRELSGMDERLVNRFAWGLIADVQPPSLEERLAILEKKALADSIALTPEVALCLASAIRSNVRELEGTLLRLGAQASLLGADITVELAREMLRRMNLEQARQITTEGILRHVAGFFDLAPADLQGQRRTRAISQPRQLAMYLARKHTRDSFPEIGQKFGGKDHTTVLAACRKIEEQLAGGEGTTVALVAQLEAGLLR